MVRIDKQTFLNKVGGGNNKVKIELKMVKSEFEKEYLSKIVRIYHSYKQSSSYSGRMINYFIYDQYRECLGVIGFGSSFFCTTAREKFIGWGTSARWQNLQNIANNWRYTIKPNNYKNVASKVLLMAVKQIQIDWKEKYGDKLYMIDTYVQPPRNGGIYLSAGFKNVGWTVGADFSGRGYSGNLTESLARCANLNTGTVVRKMVFCKPLHRYFRRRLKHWENKELKKFWKENHDKVSDHDIQKMMEKHEGMVSKEGALKMLLIG